MKKEKEYNINELKSGAEHAIFLKIDLIFKGGYRPLQIDTSEDIETPIAVYNISIEKESKLPMISAIFKCGTSPKTTLSFSKLGDKEQICLDNIKDTKLKVFFDTYYENAKYGIERLFKLIRWKYLIGDDKMQYHSEKIFWSLDEKNWKAILRCPSVENLRARVIKEEHLDISMIKELFQTEESEPIFFEILREANNISKTSLESGFVIAVSSLEVAVKYLVKNHLPETQWLIDEIPSPPIEKIIREFFPSLIPGFQFEKDERDMLKAIIFVRNKIVHSGIIDNKRKTLFQMMNFINDFVFGTINQNLK